MVDRFGPEDNRWRYPQLDTEYEPNEGRCSCRSLDQASQGHAMAEGCCASGETLYPRKSWTLSFGLCSITHERGPLVGVAVLGRGIY